MPHGQTKFNANWLQQNDKQGFKVGDWCKEDKSSTYNAFCILCKKTFLINNSGFKQILAHSEGKKHQDIASARFGENQRHFGSSSAARPSTSETGASLSVSSTQKNVDIVLNKSAREAATQAEVLWMMKVATANYSYASCDGLPQLFQRMFPCEASQHFTMSRTKASYLISDGLGPYFRKQLTENVKKSPAFVLQFDETGTVQNRKQCDILLRYWNVDKGEVVVQFCKALMFGHALGDDVGQQIIDTLQENEFQIPLSKMLNIGSDGPNVNKTIWNFINEHLKDLGFKGLLPFMPCNIHTAHNSFRGGLAVYGSKAEEMAIDLFYYFKHFPCRREDFAKCQDEVGFTEEMFIRHIQCRWLTLIPALQRVIKNWDALSKYFLTELPKSKSWKQIEKNERYIRICRKLKDSEIKVELNFIVELEPLFNTFLRMFQKEEPLIHILHKEMVDLVKSFMRRFMKGDCFEDKSSSLVKVDVSKVEHYLPDKEVEIGESARKALQELPVAKQKLPLMHMKKFLQTVVSYLQKKLPIDNEFLQDLSCLHPLKQKEERGINCIRRVAQKMVQVIKEDEIASITDEWKIYQNQKIPDEWSKKEVHEDGQIEFQRIDFYWNKILSQMTNTGTHQFKVLPKLVKSLLCLAHGNAEVERSLSENKRTVTNERTLLSESSVNGLRMVKDSVNVMKEGNVHSMELPGKLLQAGQEAHKAYIQRLQSEKEQEEKAKAEKERKKRQKEADELERQKLAENDKKLEERKRKLEKSEKNLSQEEKELNDSLETANKMFVEANNRLTKAIKNKNFDDATVAQALLEAAQKKVSVAKTKLEKCRREREDISAKKKKVLDDYAKRIKTK